MKQFNRKIKNALFMLIVFLMAFIGFSKAGVIFSDDSNFITITTTKKSFEPNNYVAAMKSIVDSEQINMATTNTTIVSTTIKTTTKVITTTAVQTTTQSSWDGPVLTKKKGVVNGPSGKETYYNLNMSGVVKIMRNAGFTEEEYPYWIRDDGVKMLGDYVMVAANLDIRPRGSIVKSSLGDAIVCDTGGFATSNPTQLDIAVTW